MKATILAFAVLLPCVAFASPSGLNNIPTADTCDPNVLVLQAYSFSSADHATQFVTGAKYGLRDHWEIGVDGAVAPDDATNGVQFQIKKAWWTNQGRTGWALGLANITGNWDDTPVFPYAVVTQKLNPRERAHLGVAPQRDATQLFAGYDHTAGKSLLRADAVFDLDNDMQLYSVGALVPTQFGAVEGWVSQAAGANDATTFTLKLDWALRL